MEHILLKKVPLFSSLNKGELESILSIGCTRGCKRDEVILERGKPGDTMFLVISGKVKLVLHGEDKRNVTLSVLKEGDFFGELSLLDEEPRSCTVIAMEDTSLFILARKLFCTLVKRHPEMILKILKEMARRLRRADEKIGSLALLDVYGRIVQVLYEIADEVGQTTEDGIVIERLPTHNELASMVGTSRESVSRVIQSLKKTRHLKYLRGRKAVLRGKIRY